MLTAVQVSAPRVSRAHRSYLRSRLSDVGPVLSRSHVRRSSSCTRSAAACGTPRRRTPRVAAAPAPGRAGSGSEASVTQYCGLAASAGRRRTSAGARRPAGDSLRASASGASGAAGGCRDTPWTRGLRRPAVPARTPIRRNRSSADDASFRRACGRGRTPCATGSSPRTPTGHRPVEQSGGGPAGIARLARLSLRSKRSRRRDEVCPTAPGSDAVTPSGWSIRDTDAESDVQHTATRPGRSSRAPAGKVDARTVQGRPHGKLRREPRRPRPSAGDVDPAATERRLADRVEPPRTDARCTGPMADR